MVKKCYWISFLIGCLLLISCTDGGKKSNSHKTQPITTVALPVGVVSSGELAVHSNLLVVNSRYDKSVKAFDLQNKQWLWSTPVSKPASSIAIHHQQVAITIPEAGELWLLNLEGEVLEKVIGFQLPWSVVPSPWGWWLADRLAQRLLHIQQGQVNKSIDLNFMPQALLVKEDRLWVAARNTNKIYSMPLDASQAPHEYKDLRLPETTHTIDLLAWLGSAPVALTQLANLGTDEQAVSPDTAIRPALIQAGKSPLMLDLSGNIISRPIALVANKDESKIWIAGASSHSIQRFESGIRNWQYQQQKFLNSAIRGLWLEDEQYLWVWQPLDFRLDKLNALNLSSVENHVATPSIEVDQEWLLGAKLFQTANDSRLSMGWMSCDSCHLDDGQDHKVWRFEQGYRNTPELGGNMALMPLHWRGDRGRIDVIELNFRHLMGGTGIAPEIKDASTITKEQSPELHAIAKYLDAIPKVRAQIYPALDTAAVTRGKTLFQDYQCDSCHTPSTAYSNMQMENIGTTGRLSFDNDTTFDVPTLNGIAYTAPYLHDGRAETLKSIFTDHNDSQNHGETNNLSTAQLNDLVQFLKSL